MSQDPDPRRLPAALSFLVAALVGWLLVASLYYGGRYVTAWLVAGDEPLSEIAPAAGE